MDLITKTPGLQYIAEQIFINLDFYSIWQCRKVNDHWWNIIMKPLFWFNKMKTSTMLSHEHQEEWIRFCEKLSKLNITQDMTPPLKYIFGELDNSVTLNATYWCTIMSIRNDMIPGYADIIRIMAPLIDNPNAPGENGWTPIYRAAYNGNTEVVKILAPLTDNPNAPNNYGRTPIYSAACYGFTEIVNILAPLTENPNAPDEDGNTPIFRAAQNGHTEIVKILAPLTDDINAPNDYEETPSSVAKNDEILRILQSFV